MRVTVHIPESVSNEIKRAAEKEKRSVSSFIAEATEYYLKEKRRKELGEKVLRLAGRVKISADALKQVEEEREEHGRP